MNSRTAEKSIYQEVVMMYVKKIQRMKDTLSRKDVVLRYRKLVQVAREANGSIGSVVAGSLV